MRQLFEELRRRNVYKVAVTYAAVAFVTLQAARLIFPATTLEGLYDKLVVLAFVGFPIALVIAWAFELTPEGVQRTAKADDAEEASGSGDVAADPEERRAQSRLAVKVLVGLGLAGAAVAGGWYLMGGGGTTIHDRSVAVLPFETLGDTGSSPFTEGLHNDLLTRLQRVSDLTVIARPSVMRYEATEKPLAQVAEELNARWIVTAAVQSADDRVQVQPRLIDPRTGTERWSDSYRGELSADVFDLQQEITRSIADALEAELASGEQQRLEERPTEDLDAYRLYVQGRQQFARRSRICPSCIEEAVKLFHRAIEQDSSFALAWTGLADAASFYSSEPPDSLVAPGVSQEFAARRALELDPDLAEAHASMGHVHLRNMDAPGARRELQRAIDLKPSYWEAHHWLGELYLKIGRADQALDHLELALELNPQHAWARHLLYDAYLAAGQAEKSLREARRQQEMGLEERSAVGGEVRALLKLGRLEEARQALHQLSANMGDGDSELFSYPRAQLGILEAAAGDTARARELLDQLPDAYDRALLRAALGDADAFFEWSDQLEQDDFSTLGVSVNIRTGADFSLEVIKDDPRYRKLIRRANRAWGLTPDGSFRAR